jgi:hypothetical protein
MITYILSKAKSGISSLGNESLQKSFITVAFVLSFITTTSATSYTFYTDVNATTLYSRTEETH